MDPKAGSAIRQGVTTLIMGNGGHSAAPLAHPEGVKNVVLGYLANAGFDITWRGMGEYLDLLEERGIAVNVGSLIGHNAIRVAGIEGEMMRRKIVISAWILAVILVFSMGVVANAAEPKLQKSPGERIAEKFFRGFSNTVFGFITDWPKTIYYETEERGPAFGLTAGFLEGIGLGIGRTLIGAFELITFPIPVPEDYRPILEPTYPFEAGKTRFAQ